MNCCDDYGRCTQANGCPAQVAKVGKTMPLDKPLPPSAWRKHLHHLAQWMLVFIWLALCFSLVVLI
jgi:hypothetical protein